MNNSEAYGKGLPLPGWRTSPMRCGALAVLLLAASMFAQGQSDLPADLVITVDNNRAYVSPGQNITYEIVVNNYGPNNVVGALVEDSFPDELINVTWVASPTAGATSGLGSGSGDISDTVDIPVGDRVVYTVSAVVNYFSVGSVTNTATVTAPPGILDTFEDNNTSTDEDPIEFQSIARIQPFYGNGWPSPNTFAQPGDTPPDQGTVAYNGHVGDWSAPYDPSIGQPRFILKTSSFGQPLGQYISAAVDIDGILLDAINELFYVPGNSSDQNNRAAFRFINTFFTTGSGGTVDEIHRRLDNGLVYDATIDPSDDDWNVSPATGITDEERALHVANEIKPLLQAFPHDRELRNLLLDIYYYRTLGRQMVAKQKVAEAYQLNFSEVLSADVSFGTPINKEIAAFKVAADALRGVLNPYIELLTDDLGVDIATQVDPSYRDDLPFGFYVFRQEVPNRSVYAPTFVDFFPDTGTVSGTPAQVLDDERQAPVLYASPTSFHVDSDGNPDGSAVNEVTFTIQNFGAGSGGAGDLHWEAVVENPTYSTGKEIKMLSLDIGGGEWGGRLASANPIEPPPAGIPATVRVKIEKNDSVLRRSGKIQVRDISGKADALTYTVIIVQSGHTRRVLGVEPEEIYYTTTPSQIFPVNISNLGTGTLDWKASVISTGLPAGMTVSLTWWPLEWPYYVFPQYVSEITGSNAAVVKVKVDGAPAGSEAIDIVKIEQVNVASEMTIVTLHTGGHTTTTAKTMSVPLLSVYPDLITVGSAAITRNFTINDVASVGEVTATATVPWVSVQPIGPGPVQLDIAENTSPSVRSGYVTVRASQTGDQSCVVTVVQDGASDVGLVVNPIQRYAGNESGEVSSGEGFDVIRVGSGDVSWTSQVSKGGHWLKIVAGESGTNDGEILYSYDENTSLHGRTGEILIQAPDAIGGQNLLAVQVFQRGAENTQVLTGGFKDLILLFDVMRDDAQVNKELARRYALRRLPGDVERAYALIGETVSRHSVAIKDIADLIPDWRDRVPQSSELVATFSGWQQAIEELATVKDFLDGDSNILGFRENFLFLVQTFQGQDPTLFDSFDKLLLYMYDDEHSTAVPTSPLGIAYDKYIAARDEYGNFVETQDTLAEELRTQNLDHRKWMYDVVGVDPGNDVDNPDDAEHYYNPSANYGGDLWQIDRSIDRAREQLKLNEAQLQKILDDINTELWRRAQEQQINAEIANLQVVYGRGVAGIEAAIGVINGAQVLADNIVEGLAGGTADLVTSAGFNVGARVVNGVFQAAAELAKGAAEAGKALLAASENADIRQREDQILDVNSQALVKNLFGEANLVGMQSTDLVLALVQEIGKRQANIDEWHYREDRMRENNAALLGRSFANPVHRLRLRLSMLEAESTFKVAQKWVFYTIRALEYKWNTPFVYSSPTGDWSVDSIFRARTARDLVLLVAAVRDYDGLLQGSSRGDDRFDWFSFKKDFYGVTPVYDSNGEEMKVYSHPRTGYGATATEVFRARLEDVLDPDTGVIDIPFSTFKDNDLTFFRGPRRDADNPEVVLSRGQYLDKIVWMKVNLLGDFTGAPVSRVGGTLTYSGGSYVRNARVGTVDPENPSRILDEFTVWPTKFWFFDSGQPGGDPPVSAAWRSSDEQTTEIALNLIDISRFEIPDTVSQIDVFCERSVASDGWRFRIYTHQNGVPVINIDQIDDIEILFYHVNKERPPLKKSETNAIETDNGT
ncbi:MAG TPA: BACON domain-containing carbohydrate-binding protein [Candidatus Bathyarchaeia archaeon]|nr:BACON domain-containing carbohydrate-binding protein [Candidatus Bathyarchaeia archaeon]